MSENTEQYVGFDTPMMRAMLEDLMKLIDHTYLKAGLIMADRKMVADRAQDLWIQFLANAAAKQNSVPPIVIDWKGMGFDK